MRLFNTLQREVTTVSPKYGERYGIYCCGPTVYGPAHIGNFRTFVLQDVFRRALELSGTPTKHVRNLTDVDDKTIRDSQAAEMTLKQFTDMWTEKFHVDCAALNCLEPHVEPSAVEHMPQQIKMIESLIEKGHAYAADDGSVYFSIKSYPEYGKLSHLDTRDLDLGKTQNQRTNDSDEYEKDSVADFVLWKSRRDEDGDNFWQSPWGEGRPGWHLECSAMIREHLGASFDMHSGGEDLVFPHHENEIAQSKCSCGGDFAAHWFHITHLLVEGKKMSKSLGNFFRLDDLLEKGFAANAVRFTLVGAHYSKQLNFTLDSLHAAGEALDKLLKAERALAELAGQDEAPSYESLIGLEDKGLFENAWEGLCEDLNTQRAIGAMFGALRRAQNEPNPLTQWKGLHFMLHALGFELPVVEEEVVVEAPPHIQELAAARWQARSDKDWAKSDELRDQLKELGWLVKDGNEGYSLEQL
ncbi:cysteine--tRNA ligase [Rubritalea marina]|uniref:cysteine--tRNA ligase n=1 Tax=Rubritalea marina TaxID=361055 RepID=UPI00037A8713|nr:cysteine--tRNA ligase [Rubritalea marina]